VKVVALVGDAFGGRGGIARYNRNFLTAVCSAETVMETICLPRHKHYDVEELPDKLHQNLEGLGGRFKYLLACLKLALFESPIDLVICSHLHLLPYAFILKIRFGARLILLTYGVEVWRPTTHRLTNILARQIKYFVSIRHFTAKRFREWAKLKDANYFYIPNCIEFTPQPLGTRYQSIREQFGLGDRCVLITVGRVDKGEIDRNKGFDEVLEILPNLLRKLPNIHYLIVGDGDDINRLERKAVDLGVSEIVTFVGYVSEGTKFDLLGVSDLFLMPGSNPLFDRYPFRFAFLEALACGLPVIGCELVDESECDDELAKKLIIQVDPADQRQLIDVVYETLMDKPDNRGPLKLLHYEYFEQHVHDALESVVQG
jgi:phosphatidyl-myo-inositol dimannoside synthase